MSDKHKLFYDGGAVFLQPESVGSSVRWNVSVERWTGPDDKLGAPFEDISVSLTDCHRNITWSGDVADMDLKLMRAIRELQEARKAIQKAGKVLAKAIKKQAVEE